jgi:HEAT repeat protein
VGLHEKIIVALGAIGPAARASVPLIEAEYREETLPWRAEAAFARWCIDGNFDGILPILAAHLDDPQVWKRAQALDRLVKIAHTSSAAVPYILLALDDSDLEIRLQAIHGLGAAKSHSTAAVPALRELALAGPLAIRNAAERALEAIQSDNRP